MNNPCAALRDELKKAMPHLILSGGDMLDKLGNVTSCLVDYHDYELSRAIEDKGGVGAWSFGSIHVQGKDVDESDIPINIAPQSKRSVPGVLYDRHHLKRCRIYEVHGHSGYGAGVHLHVECDGIDDPQTQYALVDIIKRTSIMSREDAGLSAVGTRLSGQLGGKKR